MAKVKRNLTLEDHADEILSNVGNASDWLGKSIIIAKREWDNSFKSLTGSGWKDNEIRCAARVLTGYWLSEYKYADVVEAIESADSIIPQILKANGVVKQRWATLCNRVATDESIARALWCLAQECAKGNKMIIEALEEDMKELPATRARVPASAH